MSDERPAGRNARYGAVVAPKDVQIEACELALHKRRELEAAEIWERLAAGRHLKAGAGWQLLDEIETRLADA